MVDFAKLGLEIPIDNFPCHEKLLDDSPYEEELLLQDRKAFEALMPHAQVVLGYALSHEKHLKDCAILLCDIAWVKWAVAK